MSLSKNGEKINFILSFPGTFTNLKKTIIDNSTYIFIKKEPIPDAI